MMKQPRRIFRRVFHETTISSSRLQQIISEAWFDGQLAIVECIDGRRKLPHDEYAYNTVEAEKIPIITIRTRTESEVIRKAIQRHDALVVERLLGMKS